MKAAARCWFCIVSCVTLDDECTVGPLDLSWLVLGVTALLAGLGGPCVSPDGCRTPHARCTAGVCLCPAGTRQWLDDCGECSYIVIVHTTTPSVVFA